MKKKFLEIIRKHGFIHVDYETWSPIFSVRNYQIKYKNRKGDQFHWFGRTDYYNSNPESSENRNGIFEDFERNVLMNRGGL